MSGIDPLLALMSARVAAAEAAMLEAAINLGVSTEELQAQIGIGDILAAKVLPPQGGQDLIEILGQPVVAQLPPGVHPGETLLLQVSGFAGTQIYVRNLGTPDPANPLPVVETVLKAPPPANESPTQAQGQTQTSPVQTQTQAQPGAVSPPRAVFVAASVRQASPQPAQLAQAPQSPQMQQTTPLRGLEARIAAAQAAKVPLASARASTPAVPIIPPRTEASAQNVTVQTAARAVQRTVQTVSELLRAVRLPNTPFTRMAATIAPHAPERLPSVLQRLEAALPRAAQDARISTLRTLIGFTAKLNPANAETLRAQISAYISNVVEGVETKIAQLLAAHTRTSASSAAPAPQSQPVKAAPDQQLPPAIAQARVAERSAAISYDLKSVVLSLLRDPPAERTPAMTQALSETLITLTGVQVNALSSNQQSPGTIGFTLPVYYHEGGKPAQIRISRDAESRAAKMDADNFHVAFVLDTANLGTVAIDLQTTGRTVKVDVKTESKSAAERFSDTLSSLRTRLEDLRYRVASAASSAIKTEPRPVPQSGRVESSRNRGLDLHA